MKNKIIIFLLILSIFLINPASAFAGGDGSSSNPYQISNLDELQEINNNLGANYIQINDIDAKYTGNWNGGAGFKPIGNSATPFTGTFDGNNHKIVDLYINRGSTNYVGLFGKSTGTIKNVGIININVLGNEFVGGLVGECSGVVRNSFVIGQIRGEDTVGGLIGYSVSTTISNCYTDINVVSGSYYAGGFIGRTAHNHYYISNCYSMGHVTADNTYVAGFIAYCADTFENCYTTCEVSNLGVIPSTGNTYIGGLIASGYGGRINSYYEGTKSEDYTWGNVRLKEDMTYPYNEENTYKGWDFDNTWSIDSNTNNGYPYLSNYHNPDSKISINCAITQNGESSTAIKINDEDRTGGTINSNGEITLRPYVDYPPIYEIDLSDDFTEGFELTISSSATIDSIILDIDGLSTSEQYNVYLNDELIEEIAPTSNHEYEIDSFTSSEKIKFEKVTEETPEAPILEESEGSFEESDPNIVKKETTIITEFENIFVSNPNIQDSDSLDKVFEIIKQFWWILIILLFGLFGFKIYMDRRSA